MAKKKTKPVRLKLNGEPRKKKNTLGHIANGGRPPAVLCDEEVYKLAKLWCTMEEIASHFNVSVDTIENRFSEAVRKGKEDGKASIRRMQYLSADKGNVTMQIWLGKILLKQKEEFNLNIPNAVIVRGQLPEKNDDN